MSRAEFEKWAKSKGKDVYCSDHQNREPYASGETQECWRAWLAGRESMRDEAAILCEGRAVIHYDYLSDECTSPQEISDLESHECAAAIRSIEP